MNGLKWRREDGSWLLSDGEATVGRLETFDAPGIETADHVEALEPGLFTIVRTFRNVGTRPIDGLRLTLDFIHLERSRFSMIPAVSYDGNEWGRGKEPKGFEVDGEARSFSYRRVSVPGATYSEGDRWAVALWGDPAGVPFSCSLRPAEGTVLHRLIVPEEEFPTIYSARDAESEGYAEELSLEPGRSVALKGYLSVAAAEPGHRAVRGFLSAAWEMSPRKPVLGVDPEEVWRLGKRFAVESLWAEEGSFCGFSIGLVREGGAWVQRPAHRYEIGWCGQNAGLANSLLFDYLRNGDTESLDRGIRCLDAWAAGSPLPNGLFRVHFDHVLGIGRGPEILDACNLGTAAHEFFEAADLAESCGAERPRYREIGLDICGFMAEDQEESGRYGKGWDTGGRCLYRDGTIGAFVIPPMIEAYRLTGEEPFLRSAERAFSFYFRELESRGYSTAGALDTWCIDKESSMPLLRAALMLHEVTKDRSRLDAAEAVSWYLSTWLWHYSAAYPKESDFSRYGFDTFGGTSVSVQHHHLDPYALFWVADWLDLAERTGNETWREKALAIWANGCQLVSDGSLEIHGARRPAGSQNEAFMHTRWSLAPGSMNDWLVAWPAAFRLEALRRVKDWDRLTLP